MVIISKIICKRITYWISLQPMHCHNLLDYYFQIFGNIRGGRFLIYLNPSSF